MQDLHSSVLAMVFGNVISAVCRLQPNYQATCSALYAGSIFVQMCHYLCMAIAGGSTANDTPKPTDHKTCPPLFKAAAGSSAADDWCIGTVTPALQVTRLALLLPLPVLMDFSTEIAVMTHIRMLSQSNGMHSLVTLQTGKFQTRGGLQTEV